MNAEPVASPPPPYSPRREPGSQRSPRLASTTISPADTTSPETDTSASRYTSPQTSASALSPDFLSRQATSRGGLSQHASPSSASPSLASAPSFPPPPPAPGSTSRLRSSSKDHAGRLLSSLTSRGKNSTPISGGAQDRPRVYTAQNLAQAPDAELVSPSLRAPTSRRAASTGDISIARNDSHSVARSPVVWEPGAPLPPPPPGPPPAAARTQSLNRPAESPIADHGPTLPVRTRRPPGQGTSLGPVPPTPADWREDSTSQERPRERSNGPTPLHIDTGSILRKRRSGYEDPITATAATPIHRRRDSSSGGLVRTPAVRNRSAMGLRERRSESKHGKERAVEDSVVDAYGTVAPWDEEVMSVRPTNLNLSDDARGSLHRRDPSRRTPGSGRVPLQSLDGTLSSAGKVTSGKNVSFESTFASSRSMHMDQATEDAAATPPASAQDKEFQGRQASMDQRRSQRLSQKLSLTVPSGPERRPISHILHTPNADDALQVPLTPASASKPRPVSDLLGPESPRAFAERANERHRAFARKEAEADNDSERLEMFVQYMLTESSIRREQYARVFEAEEVDTDELVKDLFQLPSSAEHEDDERQQPTGDNTSRRTSMGSSAMAESSPDEASSASRMHESPSSATTNSSIQRPVSGFIKEDYVPCLSPIASMSIVTGQDDEMNSRGRPPSRWWEDPSQSGSVANDGFSVLGRSKRESKYMGVSREAAFFDEPTRPAPSSSQWQGTGSSQYAAYGPNEYPPEKVAHSTGMVASPPFHPPTPASAPPFTPDARGLDISRLVTLPPPYPRHHPAVNNNHPDLADTRAVVRSLHEKEEPAGIRSKYTAEVSAKRKRAESWCEHQRSLHRQDVQFRIDQGSMTQAQYDDLEIALEQKIHQSDRDLAQTSFDLFQSLTVTPLHALLTSRIALATSTLQKLSSRLFSDAQHHSPNLPQEEGDEQPELLEKLTQLKWLFEAREALHRQCYELLSERNELYKAIVLLPYAQTHNADKHADALQFFASDALDRRIRFEKAVCDRASAFLCVVETNVARGVEVQLDAFWQIAPQLLELLHKIPSSSSSGGQQQRLRELEIRIPPDEYEENPGLRTWPLRYLYGLLGHAEKSSYQFIESQVNLLCLEHEVRGFALCARRKVRENEGDGEDGAREEGEEERRLTEDLKDRVGVVEGLWGDALGEEIRCVRERVRECLLESGGWDDDEAE